MLASPRPPRKGLRWLAEWIGGTPAGARLEHWEMTRKVQRLGQAGTGNPEAVFSPDVCKGHLSGHGQRILASFSARLATLGQRGFDPAWTAADSAAGHSAAR